MGHSGWFEALMSHVVKVRRKLLTWDCLFAQTSAVVRPCAHPLV